MMGMISEKVTIITIIVVTDHTCRHLQYYTITVIVIISSDIARGAHYPALDFVLPLLVVAMVMATARKVAGGGCLRPEQLVCVHGGEGEDGDDANVHRIPDELVEVSVAYALHVLLVFLAGKATSTRSVVLNVFLLRSRL